MSIIITGKVWKFGDHVNTNYMHPNFSWDMPWEERKKHILHIHKAFTEGNQPGDVIVAGNNFGCGSSREQAPLALKYSGVKCVIAESFARIFFRNAINIGLPVIECKGISTAVKNGDELAVDFEAGKIENLSNGKKFQVEKLPPFILQILADGGLIENLRRRMNK